MSLVGSRGARVLWVDASAGVAGDMLLAALVDAGADLENVQAAVDSVLPDTVRLHVREVTRAGLRALAVEVEPVRPDHPHRAWSEIRALLEQGLDGPVRESALLVFGALAEAEARVHAIAADAVVFHEVGSWDSIADIVGCCAALTELGVGALEVGPIAVGSGTVRTDHGELSVPVPAVLDLLTGWAVVPGGEGERATPTGVALLTALGRPVSAIPPMQVLASGTGAGSRDTPGRPNVVRVVVGERSTLTPRDVDAETLVVLEANVDDLDPRVWPTILADLLGAGALDAWLVPITMKKGRPAHTVAALCPPEAAATMRDVLLDTTTSLGVRSHTVERWALSRGWLDVLVGPDRVAVKVGHQDGRIVHATPEFEDVSAVARHQEVPVRDVLRAAVVAAAVAGLERGADVPVGLRSQPSRPQPGRAAP